MNKKIRILLDTNVVLDFLLKRENYAPAAKIITSPIRTGMVECLTIISISDINFLAKKDSEPRMNVFEVQDKIRELISIMDVLSVQRDDIVHALDLRWHDFEDALQYSVAVANRCNCVITNNVKDFEHPEIEVIAPQDFLAKYFAKENGNCGLTTEISDETPEHEELGDHDDW